MNAISNALSSGLRLAVAHWRLLVLAHVVNLALALPLAAALRDQIADSLGRSEAGQRLLRGFDDLWYQGFASEAQGLGETFRPSVVGIGAVFDALDNFARGGLGTLPSAIVVLGGLYLAVWVALAGGFLERFAAQRQTPFFSAAARNFPRLALLTALGVLAYSGIFAGVFRGLGNVVDHLTYESVDEREVFAWTCVRYAVTWVIVATTSLVLDYAKIITVAHTDVPPWRAVGRSVIFCGRHLPQVIALSALLWLLVTCVTLAYWTIAPGAGQSSGVAIVAAFVVSQVYVAGRIFVRGTSLAAQSHLWRSESAPRTESIRPGH